MTTGDKIKSGGATVNGIIITGMKGPTNINMKEIHTENTLSK